MNLQDALQSLSKALEYILSSDFATLSDPHVVANMRAKLVVYASVIGEAANEAKLEIAKKKHAITKRTIDLLKAENPKKMSKAEAELNANYELAQDVYEAEYEYNRLRQASSDCEQLLNAMATKFKALEMKAKNLS